MNGSARESERPRDFGGFGSVVKMGLPQPPLRWECGNQRSMLVSKLRGRGGNVCRQSPSISPSERHFHSEPTIFKHFGETVLFGKQFRAECVPFRKPRKMSTSPDSRSEPNEL
jgi:hypothetical protein